MRKRVEVMHGVNFDVLERRPAETYGGLSLRELERRVREFGNQLDLEASFFQTNHEGNFCERLHRAAQSRHGLVLNPGAWTHYSWAIREALELCGLPAVEVHLSNVDEREEWRRQSVIRDLCVGVVHGKGVDGYRDALAMLQPELGE